MNNTRTGKIARLPDSIREELNQRLQNNERGKSLIKWLNSLPEVQALLKDHFDGKPINDQNLTEWRKGGFDDWQMRQGALKLAQNLGDENSLGDKSLTADFSEKLARWLILRFAAAAQNLAASEPDPRRQWHRLHELCADVSRLRRGDLYLQRLTLQRDTLAVRQTNSAYLREKQFWQWADRPDVKEKLHAICEKKPAGFTEQELEELETALRLM
jgi:hypothetical protein